MSDDRLNQPEQFEQSSPAPAFSSTDPPQPMKQETEGVAVESISTSSGPPRLTRTEIQRARRESSSWARAKGGTGTRVQGDGKTRRVLAWVVIALILIGGFFVLRPQVLGGPVAYAVMHGSSMVPTLHDGDLVVAERHTHYQQGDVIVYRISAGLPGAGEIIIHRIVGGDGSTGFITQGDNVRGADPVNPRTANVLGSVWFYVPAVVGLAVLGAALVLLLIVLLLRRCRRRKRIVAASPDPTLETNPTAMASLGTEVTATRAELVGPAAIVEPESMPSPSNVASAPPEPEPLLAATSAVGAQHESTPESQLVASAREMESSAEPDAPGAAVEPVVWVEVERSPRTAVAPISSPESVASPSDTTTAPPEPESLLAAASAVGAQHESTAESQLGASARDMESAAEPDAPGAAAEPVVWVEVERTRQTSLASASVPEATPPHDVAREALPPDAVDGPVSWSVAEPEADLDTEDPVIAATESSAGPSPEPDPGSGGDNQGQPGSYWDRMRAGRNAGKGEPERKKNWRRREPPD